MWAWWCTLKTTVTWLVGQRQIDWADVAQWVKAPGTTVTWLVGQRQIDWADVAQWVKAPGQVDWADVAQWVKAPGQVDWADLAQWIKTPGQVDWADVALWVKAPGWWEYVAQWVRHLAAELGPYTIMMCKVKQLFVSFLPGHDEQVEWKADSPGPWSWS